MKLILLVALTFTASAWAKQLPDECIVQGYFDTQIVVVNGYVREIKNSAYTNSWVPLETMALIHVSTAAIAVLGQNGTTHISPPFTTTDDAEVCLEELLPLLSNRADIAAVTPKE